MQHARLSTRTHFQFDGGAKIRRQQRCYTLASDFLHVVFNLSVVSRKNLWIYIGWGKENKNTNEKKELNEWTHQIDKAVGREKQKHVHMHMEWTILHLFIRDTPINACYELRQENKRITCILETTTKIVSSGFFNIHMSVAILFYAVWFFVVFVFFLLLLELNEWMNDWKPGYRGFNMSFEIANTELDFSKRNNRGTKIGFLDTFFKSKWVWVAVAAHPRWRIWLILHLSIHLSIHQTSGEFIIYKNIFRLSLRQPKANHKKLASTKITNYKMNFNTVTTILSNMSIIA